MIPRELRELEANRPGPEMPTMDDAYRILDWMREVDAAYAALGIDNEWHPESGLDGWSGLPWALDPETGDVIPHPRRGKRAGQR